MVTILGNVQRVGTDTAELLTRGEGSARYAVTGHNRRYHFRAT